ncbi:uncharacterized protein [Lepeophtheirus salmonis]|nr:uncharacterized protein LOC121128187 [Lepeophtheirus salmonis]
MVMKIIFNYFYIIFVVLGSCTASPQSSSCSSAHQLKIHSSEINCGVRPHAVGLTNLPALNDNRISRVIPSYALTDRCSGACDTLECVPTKIENITVHVMAVMTRYSQGEWNTVCVSLRIEKHLDCSCSCPDDEEHRSCNADPNVYYDASSCKCKCNDRIARTECLRSGKLWNERNCGCICPQSSWRPCGTGFIFDYRETCTCVRAYNLASGNSVTLAVLIMGFITLSIAGSAFYTLKFLRRRASERRRLSLRIRLREAFGSIETLDES